MDFVSRGDIFRELIDYLAMQIVFSPRVQYLSMEDILECCEKGKGYWTVKVGSTK